MFFLFFFIVFSSFVCGSIESLGSFKLPALFLNSYNLSDPGSGPGITYNSLIDSKILLCTFQAANNSMVELASFKIDMEKKLLYGPVSSVKRTSGNIVPVGTYAVDATQVVFATVEYLADFPKTTFGLYEVDPETGVLRTEKTHFVDYEMYFQSSGGVTQQPWVAGNPLFAFGANPKGKNGYNLNIYRLDVVDLHVDVVVNLLLDHTVDSYDLFVSSSAFHLAVALESASLSSGLTEQFLIYELPAGKLVNKHVFSSGSPNWTVNTPSFSFKWISDYDALIMQSQADDFVIDSYIMDVVRGKKKSGTTTTKMLAGNRQDNAGWGGRFAPATQSVYFFDNVRLPPLDKLVYEERVWEVKVTGNAPAVTIHRHQDKKLADSNSFGLFGDLLCVANYLWSVVDLYRVK